MDTSACAFKGDFCIWYNIDLIWRQRVKSVIYILGATDYVKPGLLYSGQCDDCQYIHIYHQSTVSHCLSYIFNDLRAGIFQCF